LAKWRNKATVPARLHFGGSKPPSQCTALWKNGKTKHPFFFKRIHRLAEGQIRVSEIDVAPPWWRMIQRRAALGYQCQFTPARTM
jgi:hypothetical protein